MREVKFCRHCGNAVQKTEVNCPACGKEIVRPGVVQAPNVNKVVPEMTARRDVSVDTTVSGKTSSYGIYIFDFIAALVKRGNIPVFIYLLLNIAIMTIAFGLVVGGDWLEGFITGLIIYLISLTIALSPLGEWVLRLQTGCFKIKNPSLINRIEPLFREVYEQARKRNPSIPDDVQLFMNEDASPNAFATGRRTVCVTEGLLRSSDAEIKATLAHEFGHLAHKDTDLILLISVGNLVVSGIFLCVKAVIWLFHFVFAIASMFIGGSDGIVASIGNMFCSMLTTIFIGVATWLWTKLGILLVMKSSRENEYLADEFAFNLGYGDALCALLDSIYGKPEKGLFANLVSSHPKKNDRIAKLIGLGATYTGRF